MAYEEEDVEWWEVRARGGLPLRAGPSLTAEVVGEVLRQQRIQVSVAKVKGWLRLAAVETWMTFGRKTTAYVPMEDEGFPTVVPSTAPGGDWDQWAALLRWWPLGGVPPLLPATLGGAYLCHWRKNPRDGDASIKAHWLRPGEELQFVGPADAKAGHLCRWLQQDMALGPDLEVVLVQDQLALDGCSRLLDHTDMKSVTGPFCALTFARPRLLAAEEAPLLQLAREEAWCLRDASNHGAVVRAVNRWITSVYCQASQRLLAFFEELSQAVPAVTVVAVVPGHVPLKEACIEALALTDEARSRARLLRGLRHGQAPEWLPAAEQVLELFSRRLHCFTLLGAHGPCLYLAQDMSALGHPVLGILTTREGLALEEPPPLALGLKVTLEGLSGDIINSVGAARDWTVGQLKDTLGSRHEVRLLLPSEATELRDEQHLSSLLVEDATHLLLRLLRVDPRWSSARQRVSTDAQSWRDLEEDLKADRGIALLAVAQEPSLLSESVFLSDAEVVLAAAKKDTSVLPLASHELWNDDAFVEAAIALDAKKAVQLALDSRLDELSAQQCLQAVRQNGLVLELLPLPLRSPEILQAAMEQDVCALQFAPEAMKDDPRLLEKLLRLDGRALRYASRKLRGERSLVLLAIATCPRVVLCASEEVLKDREVLGAAMDGDPQLAQQLAHYATRT